MSNDSMSVNRPSVHWAGNEVKEQAAGEPQLGQLHGHEVKNPSQINTSNAPPTPSSNSAAPTKKLTVKEKIKGAHSDALSYVAKTFPKPVSKIVHIADKVFVGILKAVKEEAEIWSADLLTDYDWPEEETPEKGVDASVRVDATDAGGKAEKASGSNKPTRAQRPTYGSWGQTAKKANRNISNTPPLLARWENTLTEQLGNDPARIMDEKSTNPHYQAAVASAIKDLQKAYDKSTTTYTVQGGFNLNAGEAVEALKHRSAAMWASKMVEHQELTDHQIDADAGRSVTQVGKHPATLGPAEERAKALRENLKADIEAQNSHLRPAEVAKVQRYILEKLDETNTNMELMAAVYLGYGNRDLIVVQPDTDDVRRIDIKQAEVAPGQVKITVPSQWKINENTQNTQSPNERPHTFGKVEATYVLNVTIDDILKDIARLQVPDITVTKIKK